MKKGRLTFVGLGLYDENDVSLRGFDEIKDCDKVFAEFYTSKLTGLDLEGFERKLGKTIDVVSREETEKGDRILEHASNGKVVFLTCGDPMIATTHVDLRIRAMKKGIETRIVHSGSIVTAAPGLLGLQNYKFGRATTVAFPQGDYFPTSPYMVIKGNRDLGLHTLVLLDVQNDVCMTAKEGIRLLLKMEEKMRGHVLGMDSVICVVAGAGSPNPVVRADTVESLISEDYGPPPHTLVVPGRLHFMEIEALEIFAGLPKEIGRKLQKL